MVSYLVSSIYLHTSSHLLIYFPNIHVFLPNREGEGLDAGTEKNINLYHHLFYHFLGTNQCEDILCWIESEHPKWIFHSRITEYGKVGRILCTMFQIKYGILDIF